MNKTVMILAMLCTAFFCRAQSSGFVSGEIVRTYGEAPFNIEVNSTSPGALGFTLLSGTSVSVTPQGIVTILKPGTSVVQVSQAASPPFTANSQLVNIVIKKLPAAVRITSSSEIKIGENLKLTAETSPPGATVSWSIQNQTGTSASIQGNDTLVAGNTAGELMVLADIVEDEYFTNSASSTTLRGQVVHVNDTSGISGLQLNDRFTSYGQGPFPLEPTSKSSGAYSYSVISGNAAIVTPEGMVQVIRPGNVVVEVFQQETLSFLASRDTATIFISKAAVGGFLQAPEKIYVGQQIPLKVTSFPAGAKFQFSIISQEGTNASITDTVLTAGSATGALTINAQVMEDEFFSAASSSSTISARLTVADTSGMPVISFNNIESSFGVSYLYLHATSTSPGKKSFKIISGVDAEIVNDSILKVTRAGIVTVQMDQEASGSFQAASKTITVTIHKARPYFTITSANKVGVNGHIQLTAESYPPGASFNWSIKSESGTMAAISGNELSAGPSAGSLIIQAEVVEDENFSGQASSSTFHGEQEIIVHNTSGVPVMSFGNLTTKFGEEPFLLKVNSDSPGRITFSVLEGKAATVSPQGLVTLQEPGVVTIQAYQEPSPPYESVTYTTLLKVSGDEIVLGINDAPGTTGDLAFGEVITYPNPVKDKLYIKRDVNQNTHASFRLLDSEGVLLLQSNEGSKNADTELDMANLNPGVYLLNIRYGHKEIVRRIVKQ